MTTILPPPPGVDVDAYLQEQLALVEQHTRLKYSEDQPRDDQGRWTDEDMGGRPVALAIESLKAGGSAKIRPENLRAFIHAVTQGSVQANLSRLQVEGYPNLFDKHLRDLPRGEMPQIPRDNAGLRAFAEYLGAQGMRATWEQVDPSELVATQSEMNTRKMAEVYNRYAERGGSFAEDKGTLIVSKEGGILDGHHRWAAAAAYSITHKVTPINVLRIDTDIDSLLKASNEYPGADERRHFAARPDPKTKPLGEPPPGPPPPGDGWLWFDGQWIQILSDDEVELKYNPDQPRDADGRWSAEGGSAQARALTAREQAAVTHYASGGFYGINHLLRHGELGYAAISTGARLDQVEREIEQLDSAIAAQPPSTEERVLYRGSNFVPSAGPGTVFRDKGFVSTSKDLPESLHFAARVMEIHVPAGVKMLDVGDMKSFDEHEVILPRGSKFRIDSVGSYRPPLGTFDYTLMKVTLQP